MRSIRVIIKEGVLKRCKLSSLICIAQNRKIAVYRLSLLMCLLWSTTTRYEVVTLVDRWKRNCLRHQVQGTTAVRSERIGICISWQLHSTFWVTKNNVEGKHTTCRMIKINNFVKYYKYYWWNGFIIFSECLTSFCKITCH